MPLSVILAADRPLDELIPFLSDPGGWVIGVFVSQAYDPAEHSPSSSKVAICRFKLVWDDPEGKRVVGTRDGEDILPEAGLSDEHV